MKIYSSKNCGYCNDLKEKLDKLEIKYVNVDTDAEHNKFEWDLIVKLAGEDVVPMISIKPKLLVPKRSFNTIDQAVELIQSLIEK